MADTRPFDRALFSESAIGPKTARQNAQVVELLEVQPEWWIALARVAGVLCARRFRTGAANPKYIALYHLAAPGVIDSREWKEASASTPMPQRVRNQITNRLHLVCQSYSRT